MQLAIRFHLFEFSLDARNLQWYWSGGNPGVRLAMEFDSFAGVLDRGVTPSTFFHIDPMHNV